MDLIAAGDRIPGPLAPDPGPSDDPRSPRCTGAAAPQVLVVDDDRQHRGFVREVLSGERYRVLEAADGDEALDLFRATVPHPSAVITNLMMPKKEGLALIGELRDIDPRLPVLAMTGHGGIFGERYLRAARALGADDTLSKPFTPTALLEALERLGVRAR